MITSADLGEKDHDGKPIMTKETFELTEIVSRVTQGHNTSVMQINDCEEDLSYVPASAENFQQFKMIQRPGRVRQ